METITTIEVNGNAVIIDDVLNGFNIHQKQSSNVDYFGVNESEQKLLVQFKGGTGAYIYYGVPADVLKAALNSESIGKFISGNIVGKFQQIKYTERLVKLVPAW